MRGRGRKRPVIPNIDEVVEEVRKTDVAIINYILAHGKLARICYHKIARPSLVKVRTQVMEKLGILKSYAFGSIRTHVLVTKEVDLSDLPINSDRLWIWKYPIYRILYFMIQKYQPISSKQMYEIFYDVLISKGIRDPMITRGTVVSKIMILNKHKVVRYDRSERVWYTTDYKIYIDEYEYEESIEEWIKHRIMLKERVGIEYSKNAGVAHLDEYDEAILFDMR